MNKLRRLILGRRRFKNDRELRFWRKILATEGGIPHWRGLYCQLYCHYLGIAKETFAGRVVADIGCGPHGAVGLFAARQRFGIDPLVDRYRRHFDLTGHDTTYLSCGAEKIPLPDGSVDTVISRNALDHVDNKDAVFDEIHRILRPGGEFVLSVNYQEAPTRCEPQVFDDDVLHRLLEGRFDYKIAGRFPKGHDSGIGDAGLFIYPHEIVTVRGTRS
jgi:SAM-dependent methyltransferase